MTAFRIASVLFLAACLAAACGSRRDDARSIGLGSGVAGEAAVAGTVLDAASGEPVAGVRIAGPANSRAVSDRDGRFLLRDLSTGAAGEIVAELSDGRSVRQKLRPLAPGTLEVVIHVPRR